MSSYKVRISGPGGTIWCEASPTISENRQASYTNYDIVHLPADIFAYRNTSSRTFSIGCKLVSRNEKEAIANANYKNLARQWMLPAFGSGAGIAGSTPPILKLYAYDDKNISGLPVILKSYSWNFPDDIDYIFTANENMPIISTLTMELSEAYSASQITAGLWKIKSSSSNRAIDVGGGSSNQTNETPPINISAGSTLKPVINSLPNSIDKQTDLVKESVTNSSTRSLDNIRPVIVDSFTRRLDNIRPVIVDSFTRRLDNTNKNNFSKIN